jgi:release factor glutamine methyltransferase
MAEPRRKEAPPETVRSAFGRAARALAGAGIDTAGLDARLLVSHATGLSHERFIAAPARPLDAAETELLDELVERRLSGEPVARILGFKEFWGREFALGAETLVPRPDSELLVEAGLACLRDRRPEAHPRIADLGTGSGCLLVSLLADYPGAVGLGIDISLAALRVAAANAARHGVAESACFAQADWLDALAPGFDLIVANPPYVPAAAIAALPREVERFDPRGALDGGPDGLSAIRAIAAAAPAGLAPGGVLLVEVGAGQARAAADLIVDAGLLVNPEGDLMRDLASIERVVRARRAH